MRGGLVLLKAGSPPTGVRSPTLELRIPPPGRLELDGQAPRLAAPASTPLVQPGPTLVGGLVLQKSLLRTAVPLGLFHGSAVVAAGDSSSVC
jgi:hypothetical protein